MRDPGELILLPEWAAEVFGQKPKLMASPHMFQLPKLSMKTKETDLSSPARCKIL
jgi:hypothetical protein